MNRIPGLEQAVITLGSQKLIEENPSLAGPEAESALILEVRRQHEKELRNLALQENRLTRRRERETSELERIQTARKQKEESERKQKEEEALREAAKVVILGRHLNQNLIVPGLGVRFFKAPFSRLSRNRPFCETTPQVCLLLPCSCVASAAPSRSF